MSAIRPLLQQAAQLLKSGQFHKAREVYERILSVQPDTPAASLNLGVVSIALGQFSEAAAIFKRIIEQDPGHVEAWSNLAKLYCQQKQWIPALACCHQVLGLQPDRADMVALRRQIRQAPIVRCQGEEPMSVGEAFRKAWQHHQAQAWDPAGRLYRAILEVDPCYKPALLKLGALCLKCKQVDEAVDYLTRLIQLDPLNEEALCNLGIAYVKLNRFEEAEHYSMQALGLDPQNSQLYLNLGTIYYQEGHYDLAIQYFWLGVQRTPTHLMLRLNLGLMLLTIGEFEQGFRFYEDRFKAWSLNHLQEVQQALPRWQGQPLEEKCCLLWCEQGLGDAIHFARYVPGILERGARVILAVRAPLEPLFQRCFKYRGDPRVTIVKDTDVKDADVKDADVKDADVKDPVPVADFQSSLLSLPRFFEQMPGEVPYLLNPEGRRSELGLPETGSLRVGICWASDPGNRWLYEMKSLPVSQVLSPLLKFERILWVGLQVGVDGEQLQPWLGDPRVCSMGSKFQDFADTAAVIAQLDLVITVDTAVGHLAGAMGKPTWILLPHVADWRWGLEGEGTLWYPTARLFRQPRRGDWESVMQKVAERLGGVLQGESALFQVDLKPSGTEARLRRLAQDLKPRPLIKGEGFNRVVKARHGYLIYNKNDIYIGRSIEQYGEFSESEIELFQHLRLQDSVVVEVGSNIGAHTLALAKLVGPQGRVFGFEPQRILFQTLCGNLALNSITNVECFQMAVGAEAGFVLIPDLAYDRENNFGGVSVDQVNQGSRVPKVRLDDVLNLSQLRLLKVDVEGMEAEVIQGSLGLIERFRPVLYVENDREAKSAGLIELIGSLGYVMYWHQPLLFNGGNYRLNPVNVFDAICSRNMLCIHRSFKQTIQLPLVV